MYTTDDMKRLRKMMRTNKSLKYFIISKVGRTDLANAAKMATKLNKQNVIIKEL